MISSKDKLSFEEAFEKLESIVASLEKGESTLEESITSFEEGMKLVQVCTKTLNEAETRLKKLVKDENGEFRLEEMD